MHRHCGTNNRAPRWTFTDPCKPEVRPGAREESASPAWLAAPTMNARGSEEERGLVISITKTFPVATHVLCLRHLRDNAKQHLIDDAVDKSDRDKILKDIFGTDGLLDDDDSVVYGEKWERLRSDCKDISD